MKLGSRLSLLVLGLASNGCGGEATEEFVLRIENDPGAPLPDYVLMTWERDGERIFIDQRIPERGALVPSGDALATAVVQISADSSLSRRATVRGILNSEVVSEGIAAFTVGHGQRSSSTVVLRIKERESGPHPAVPMKDAGWMRDPPWVDSRDAGAARDAMAMPDAAAMPDASVVSTVDAAVVPVTPSVDAGGKPYAGLNLVRNPGFEDGLVFWVKINGSGTAVTPGHGGQYALAESSGYSFWQQDLTGWHAGGTYRLSASVRAADQRCRIGIQGGVSGVDGVSFRNEIDGFTDVFSARSGDFTLPARVAWLQVFAMNDGDTSCVFDDFEFYQKQLQ